MEKEKSLMVHERNLEQFLESLGLLDDIQNGKIECFNCKDKISLNNFQSVFPLKGKIKVCCSKFECFQIALEFKRGQRK